MSDGRPPWLEAKWIFWTDNPIGNMLHSILEILVEAGVLEKNEDEQYRYNPDFEPPWQQEVAPESE